MAVSRLVRVGGGALALTSLSLVGLAQPAAAYNADPNGCPCSFWTADTVPGTVDSEDARAVELGVRFTVDVAAPITGLRFYKAEANTGPHTASLWSTDGTLLARATFTNETASGWQTVTFATPVAAAPGTQYIASYHTTTGHYSYDGLYFEAGPIDRGILHAPGGSYTGPNGVFLYTDTPGFPATTFRANNYWVDVVVGPTRTLTGLTVTGAPTSLAKGLSRQLTATGALSDATTVNLTGEVQWASSNPAVATVSATGLLQAAGVGTATVTASINGVTTSVPVTVTPAAMVSVVVTPANITMKVLAVQQFKATASFTDGTTTDVTNRARWTTSNILVAVPGNVIIPGKVLALLPGTGTITATVDGMSGSTPVIVKL